MFDDLYTQLTRKVPYKTLMVIPIAIALLMLLFIPSIPLGIEFKGGTSIDITLDKDIPQDELKNLRSELSAQGLGDTSTYITKSVTSDKRTLTIETTTQIESENESNIVKILEKYTGRLNKFDFAEARLQEKPSKDKIEELSQRLNIKVEDIKFDEDKNSLTITALSLDEKELQGILNYYFESNVSVDVYKGNFMINPISPSLGEKFQTQGMKALLVAFILMAFVVFIAFSSDISFEAVVLAIGYTILVIILMSQENLIKNIVVVGAIFLIYLILMAVFVIYRLAAPASAVIAAAAVDILIALGGMSLIGIELKPASLAALLMLIGYSVDSDILLTSRVLRTKVGTIDERIDNAMKTGLTMTGTTIGALTVLFVISSMVTQIELITSIMSVLLIGLFADLLSTWFMNTGILKWYLEQSAVKKKKFKFGFSIFSR